MLRSIPTLFLTILVLLVSACSPNLPATPAPILTDEPSIPVTGSAVVQSLEIQLPDTNPLQVNAILRGQLPDSGCTTISSVNQAREGNTIRLTVITSTTNDPAVSCMQVLTPFEQVVSLDVASLPPGTYTVHASGLEQTFTLPSQSVEQFRQELVAALNARDYGKLQSLMDPTFMIAYWQSEGTSNTPEQAIEQLQRNLLSSSAPIAADPNKDLAALLDMNPVTILGPDVMEASPLFTSGWGPEGKDEAIHFIARRQNGSFYWYGLLFARDGFKKQVPVVITPVVDTPVDTNAYPTQVKFVMALQDVRMRSGPGMQFNIISFLAGGQTAKVTGVSANGAWWRVICPDNSTGSCWVSAASNLTRPANAPGQDTSPYPTSVKNVTALRDVNIYIGPGTQYDVVGLVRAGDTVPVLGVNVDKSWWQVPCLADEVNCWITADPSYTRPIDPSGKADVQSVEVQVLQSQPIQAIAIARGMLPDSGCTSIAVASQVRNGNTFTIALTTKLNPNAMCAQVLTPFEYSIPLDVSSLIPGHYIADVNGVEGSFDLPVSVTPELPGS